MKDHEIYTILLHSSPLKMLCTSSSSCNQLSQEEGIAFCQRLFAKYLGWDRQEVRDLVTETLTEVIEPLIYREALELIDHHLATGDEVWIVSSSPVEIVEPFADLIGVTGAVASRADGPRLMTSTNVSASSCDAPAGV